MATWDDNLEYRMKTWDENKNWAIPCYHPLLTTQDMIPKQLPFPKQKT
jgi:hypothetical protein